MRIVFTRFPLESIAGGGAEQQIQRAFYGLQERGHSVWFFGSCKPLLKTLKPGLFFHIGPPPVTKARMIDIWFERKRIARLLAHEMKDLEPTTIVMFSLTEKLFLTPWCLKNSVKVIWVEHDPVGRWLRWNFWLPRLRRLSKQVTTLVVSPLSKQEFVKLGWDPRIIECIANGIDIPAQVPHKIPSPGPFRIGCIARLEQEKGVDVLLDALNGMDNYTLTILGKGSQQSNLLKQAAPLNHGRARVEFIDRLPDLEDFYRNIDCLVLPSRSNDPFGLTVAEAMARGIPTIMTDQCGISGYLEDGKDAIICKTTDLQQELTRLMSNGDLQQQLAHQGRQTIAELCSKDTMAKRYEKIVIDKSS